ncbi:hypothetical protein [Alkaliphilus hydrothermalis]|uniref:Sporulation protein YjcZ n=1 Tax=Alkaliphilus hydrothermalis TaxID=1482730 RepID=A0ABS2NT54_9FIRM|nr:hypothetical protein [Alkaliphilus hydrothermalis]MBM7616011.1 hypothetical protein [Alkaliphilus hydrothermalis]
MSEVAAKATCNPIAGLFGGENSLLFFFLLLVIIFCNCGLFAEAGDSLLFFFLLLVLLFGGNYFWR